MKWLPFPRLLHQNRPPRRSASLCPRSSPTTGPTSGGRMPWRRAGGTAWTWRPASCASGPRRGSSSMGTNRWSAPRPSQEEVPARLLQIRWHRRPFLRIRTNRCRLLLWITAADRGGWGTQLSVFLSFFILFVPPCFSLNSTFNHQQLFVFGCFHVWEIWICTSRAEKFWWSVKWKLAGQVCVYARFGVNWGEKCVYVCVCVRDLCLHLHL